MSSTLNLKKNSRRLIGKREAFIMLFAVILTSIGIKASDYFSNVNKDDLKANNGCPNDMVYVVSQYGGFCIDKYEASPSEECPYQDPNNKSETAVNLGTPGCKPVSKSGRIPWRNITQAQAMEACAKAGKRLPTNLEWYLASLGTPDPSSGWGPDDCHVNKNWEKQPGLTGSGKNCVSSAGAYDMIGNIWEWVNEEIQDGKYKDLELPESGYVQSVNTSGLPIETNKEPEEAYYNDYFWIKSKGIRGMARGGYWDNKSDAGKYAVYLVSPPSFVGTGVGFRCAK